MLTDLLDWVRENEALLAVTAAVSVVTFVGTLVVVPILLTKMRPDYFVGEDPPPGGAGDRHPVLRIAWAIVKNLLGVILLLMGIAMLVLPGQGLLTILIGLALVDFPGKRRLARKLVSRRAVRRSINWIRRRAGEPPLMVDDELASR